MTLVDAGPRLSRADHTEAENPSQEFATLFAGDFSLGFAAEICAGSMQKMDVVPCTFGARSSFAAAAALRQYAGEAGG